MRSNKKAFTALVLAVCAVIALGAVLAVSVSKEPAVQAAMFNQSTVNYTLQDDYNVTEYDTMTFADGMTLDLGGNVLNLNNSTLYASAGAQGTVTLANGTIANGTPVLTSGLQCVTLRNVRTDTTAESLCCNGTVSLFCSQIGSMVVVAAEDRINYAVDGGNVVTVSDITVDKDSVVGTLVLDAPANVKIAGFVGILYLTEKAEYSYVELLANANVGTVYLMGSNVFLNVHGEAFVRNAMAAGEAWETVLAPDVYVESMTDEEMDALIADVPTYRFVSNKTATCVENGNVVFYNDKSGKNDTYTVLAKHKYDEGTPLYDGPNPLFNITEYHCEYCGDVKRTMGEKERSIDNCDNVIDLLLLALPDFNYDFNLDSGMTFGGYVVDGGYVHLVSANGKLTGAITANVSTTQTDLATQSDATVRAYISNERVYVYTSFVGNMADMESLNFQGYYDLNEILTDLLTAYVGDSFGTPDDIFDVVKTVYDIGGTLICAQPEIEAAMAGALQGSLKMLVDCLPVAFWDSYLSETELFTRQSVDKNGNITYVLDVSYLQASLTDLLFGSDKATETDDLIVVDFINEYLYPVAEGETLTGDRIDKFLQTLPNRTGEEVIDALVTLAEGGGLRSEDLFDAINSIISTVLTEEEFDAAFHGDIRSLVDGDLAQTTIDDICAANGIPLDALIDNVNSLLSATVASVIDNALQTYFNDSTLNCADLLEKLTNDLVAKYGSLTYVTDAEGNLLHVDVEVMEAGKVQYVKTYGVDGVGRALRVNVATATDGDIYAGNAVVTFATVSDCEQTYLTAVNADCLLVKNGVTETDAAFTWAGNKEDVNGIVTYVVKEVSVQYSNEASGTNLDALIKGEINRDGDTDRYELTACEVTTDELAVSCCRSENLDTMMVNVDYHSGDEAFSLHQTDAYLGVVSTSGVLNTIVIQRGDGMVISYTDTLAAFDDRQRMLPNALLYTTGTSLSLTTTATDKFSGKIIPMYRLELLHTTENATTTILVEQNDHGSEKVLTEAVFSYLYAFENNYTRVYAAQNYTVVDAAAGLVEQNSVFDLTNRGTVFFCSYGLDAHADYVTIVTQTNAPKLETIEKWHAVLSYTEYTDATYATPGDWGTFDYVNVAYDERVENGKVLTDFDCDINLLAYVTNTDKTMVTPSRTDVKLEFQPTRGPELHVHYYETWTDGKVVGRLTDSYFAWTKYTNSLRADGSHNFWQAVLDYAPISDEQKFTFANVVSNQYPFDVVRYSLCGEKIYDGNHSYWDLRLSVSDEVMRQNAAGEREYFTVEKDVYDITFRNSDTFAFTFHRLDALDYYKTDTIDIPNSSFKSAKVYYPIQTPNYDCDVVDWGFVADKPLAEWKNGFVGRFYQMDASVAYRTPEDILADLEAGVVTTEKLVYYVNDGLTLLDVQYNQTGERDYAWTLSYVLDPLTFDESYNYLTELMNGSDSNDNDAEVLLDENGHVVVLSHPMAITYSERGFLDEAYKRDVDEADCKWTIYENVTRRLSNGTIYNTLAVATDTVLVNGKTIALHTPAYIAKTLPELADVTMATITKTVDDDGTITWTWKDNLWMITTDRLAFNGKNSRLSVLSNTVNLVEEVSMNTAFCMQTYNELYGENVVGNTIVVKKAVDGTKIDYSVSVDATLGNGLTMVDEAAVCNENLTLHASLGLHVNTDPDHYYFSFYTDAEDLMAFVCSDGLKKIVEEYREPIMADKEQSDLYGFLFDLYDVLKNIPVEPGEWFSIALDKVNAGYGTETTLRFIAYSEVRDYVYSASLYQDHDVYGIKVTDDGYLVADVSCLYNETTLALTSAYLDIKSLLKGTNSDVVRANVLAGYDPAIRMTFDKDTGDLTIDVSFEIPSTATDVRGAYSLHRAVNGNEGTRAFKINENGNSYGYTGDGTCDKELLPFSSVMEGKTKSEFEYVEFDVGAK